MPGDIGRLRRSPLGPLASPDILEVVDDGSKGGRLLQDSALESAWSTIGRSAIPHHFYCGGGCDGDKLGDGDGIGSGVEGRAWTEG